MGCCSPGPIRALLLVQLVMSCYAIWKAQAWKHFLGCLIFVPTKARIEVNRSEGKSRLHRLESTGCITLQRSPEADNACGIFKKGISFES